MKEKGEAYVNPFILEMLHQVITSTDLDFEQKNHLALYHLHVYYYLKSEGEIAENIFSHAPEVVESFIQFIH